MFGFIKKVMFILFKILVILVLVFWSKDWESWENEELLWLFFDFGVVIVLFWFFFFLVVLNLFVYNW